MNPVASHSDINYGSAMSPLGEFAFATLFGTVGFYTVMISIDSYRKDKARKYIGLAAGGIFVVGLGIALLLL